MQPFVCAPGYDIVVRRRRHRRADAAGGCLPGSGVETAIFFRPPEGRFSESQLRAIMAQGYRTVFWSFGYADRDNEHQPSAAAAKAKILDNLHNGAVILLHPTSATNAEILPALLEQGYCFVTVSRLIDG